MESRIKRLSIATVASAALVTGVAYSQGRGGGGGTWSTSRGDAQRTAWVRTDSMITLDTVRTKGLDLEWTTKVGHRAGEILTEAAAGNTTQLDPQPGNIGGSGNNLYAYEVDTGAITWTKHFNVAGAAASTALCPGGVTSVGRLTELTGGVEGAGVGRQGGAAPAGGRGVIVSDYRKAVGAPGEGVPADMVARPARGGRGGSGGAGGGAVAFGPPAGGGGGAARGASGAPARVGLRGAPEAAYAISSDGMLHGVGQAQGKELDKPIAFLPANANASGVILIGETVYAATVNGCGGAPNGVWSVNTQSGAVNSWKSGASPSGPAAFSSNGTLYVAIGDGTAGPNGYSDAVVALDAKTLAVKDWFTTPGASFSTGAVILSSGGKELVAAATKDGRVFLLDSTSLGGANHKTALATSAATNTSKTWSPNGLASWTDGSGVAWIAVPSVGAKGGITALKVSGSALEPGWTSSAELASPSAPVVVNGVVFALNDGSAGSNAVLHAFDASDGKEVWTSGAQIKSYVKSTGLWASNGEVHVATVDATVYAFGTANGRHL